MLHAACKHIKTNFKQTQNFGWLQMMEMPTALPEEGFLVVSDLDDGHIFLIELDRVESLGMDTKHSLMYVDYLDEKDEQVRISIADFAIIIKPTT